MNALTLAIIATSLASVLAAPLGRVVKQDGISVNTYSPPDGFFGPGPIRVLRARSVGPIVDGLDTSTPMSIPPLLVAELNSAAEKYGSAEKRSFMAINSLPKSVAEGLTDALSDKDKRDYLSVVEAQYGGHSPVQIVEDRAVNSIIQGPQGVVGILKDGVDQPKDALKRSVLEELD